MSTYGTPQDSLFGRTDAPRRTDAASLPASRHDSPQVVKAAEREMNETGRRGRTLEAVLAALRGGPRTSSELGRITHRFSARVHDLRRQGFAVLTTSVGDGEHLYTLTRDIERKGTA